MTASVLSTPFTRFYILLEPKFRFAVNATVPSFFRYGVKSVLGIAANLSSTYFLLLAYRSACGAPYNTNAPVMVDPLLATYGFKSG